MKQFLYILLFISFSTYGQGLNPALVSISIGQEYTPPTGGEGLVPIITNFSIPNAYPNRVQFDASEWITATTKTSFKIEGKTISSVIIDADGLGGYFTLSENLTFWDNILIRYEGNADTNESDLQDSVGNTLYDFTLQYVENRIDEPINSNIYYVATNGDDNVTLANNDINNPWKTINKAAQTVTSGSTVWIKAGDYGSENVVFTNNGLENAPIKFIGYETEEGDNPTLTRSVGMAFNNSKMPILQNASGTTIAAEKNYLIIRNVQIFDFDVVGISVNDSHSTIIDNVYIDGNASGESCIWSNRQYDQGNNRIINSYLANATDHGYKMAAVSNLIHNTWAVSSKVSSMDYYFLNDGGLPSVGHSTAIIDCYINRYADDSHSGHGISLKSDQHLNGWVIEHTLVENCEIINSKMQFRHRPTKYNIARDISITGQYAVGDNNVGINLNDGCSYNICENFTMTDVEWVIQFYETVENGGDQENAHHNKFINFTVNSSKLLFRTGTYLATQALTIVDNEIINCTFNDITNLYNDASIDVQSSNTITNSIFTNSPSLGSGDLNATFAYSDFYSGFATPSGTENISVNPNFVNLVAFVPQEEALRIARLSDIFYDKNGGQRFNSTTIGAVILATETEETPRYFIATSGSDSNNGLTSASAWQTLPKIETESSGFVAGDIIGFKGGDEFYGTLSLVNVNGSINNPITLTSYDAGQAKIVGDKNVSSWVDQGSNIWKYNAGTDIIYHVTVNNTLQTNSRLPEIVSDTSTKDNYYSITSTNADNQFISSELIGAVDIVGAKIFMISNPFTINYGVVTSFNDVTGEVITDVDVFPSIGELNGFWVSNHINLLTKQGYWYFDESNNDLYMYSVGEPTNVKVIDDSTGLIRGLRIASNYIDINNLEIRGYKEEGIKVENKLGISITNNTVSNVIERGIISYDSQDIKINNNTVHSISNLGISSTDIGMEINDNIIYDIGLPSQISYLNFINGTWTGNGIYCIWSGTVKNNDIQNVGRNGIYVKGSSVIQENYIYNHQLLTHDAGGIYTQDGTGDASTVGLLINKNIIIIDYDTNYWSSYGIYADDDCVDMSITNNSIQGHKSNIFSHNSQRVTFDGNNSYMSLFEGILYRNDNIGVLNAEDNINTNNNIYNESTNPNLKISNAINAELIISESDNNYYYNTLIPESFNIATTAENSYMTLSEWTTFSGLDVNSTETIATNTGSCFAYNKEKTTQNISLPVGDWYDFNANKYTGTITLQPFTSKILVDVWVQPLGTLVTNGGFDADTDWDKQNGTTITGGKVIVNTTANYAIALRQLEPVGMVETSSYTVKFKITNYVSGDLICAIGTTANDKTPLINADGEYTFVLERQTGALDRLIFNTAGNGAVMNLDNVSIILN